MRDGACQATRRDGRPCGSVIVLPSGRCPMHDPNRQAQIRTARATGGRNKSRAARAQKLIPNTLRPIFDLIGEALRQTYAGEMDPRVLTALAAGVSAIVKIYSSVTVEQQIADLQDQVDRLQAPASARRGA